MGVGGGWVGELSMASSGIVGLDDVSNFGGGGGGGAPIVRRGFLLSADGGVDVKGVNSMD
jgi:hypothetical protein